MADTHDWVTHELLRAILRVLIVIAGWSVLGIKDGAAEQLDLAERKLNYYG